MTRFRTDIRLALPSKGRLAEESINLLTEAGLRVYKPNPRQYQASIPSLPGLAVLFQRAGDIAVSVREGSVDFGITGWDVVSERIGRDLGTRMPTSEPVIALLTELGYGHCYLQTIVPEEPKDIRCMSDLGKLQDQKGRPLRVATKYDRLTGEFFAQHGLYDIQLISAEGTLEIAPSIGYADLIVDLVSTGTTLRDNRLRALEDGLILRSQACLIANRQSLSERPRVLSLAKRLMEFIVASLRAEENVAVFANVRSETPQSLAEKVFSKQMIGGLQGPTISQVITRDEGNWYAVNIIVRKDQLAEAIAELREIGGSGVVVSPVDFIFEEEPVAIRDMLAALEG